MALQFPIDLEQKVKLAPAVGGRGYPYQLSAKDLMKDFKFAALEVDETPVGTLRLEHLITGETRMVKLSGTLTGGDGSSANHPFKITVSGGTYRIGKGSITDGANGDAIDLTGIIETDLSASAGYVVISAQVDSALVITSWNVSVVTSDDAKEVLMTTVAPVEQEEIRLLIGRLDASGDAFDVTQMLFTSVRISYGLLNGVAVKVFDAAPTHQTVY